MQRGLAIVRWLWIACSVAVLLATLYFLDGTPNGDASSLLYFGMLILSVPVSILVSTGSVILARVAFETSGYIVTTTVAWTITMWLLFFIPGYWQWFVFLPRVVARSYTARCGRQSGLTPLGTNPLGWGQDPRVIRSSVARPISQDRAVPSRPTRSATRPVGATPFARCGGPRGGPPSIPPPAGRAFERDERMLAEIGGAHG